MAETLKEKMERDLGGLEMELDALMKSREEKEQEIADELTVDSLFRPSELTKLFEQSLYDQTEGSIYLFGVEFDPVKIVRELDPTHYDCMESEWRSEFEENLTNTKKYKKALEELNDDLDSIDSEIDIAESDIETMKAEIAKLEE